MKPTKILSIVLFSLLALVFAGGAIAACKQEPVLWGPMMICNVGVLGAIFAIVKEIKG